MKDEERQATEMMRDGSYFDQSRQWFATLYIAPISERSFFLIIGVLATLVGIVGFAAFMGLLPITSRPAVVINNARMDDTQPQLIRLREGGNDINHGMLEFFLKRYVKAREEYLSTTFETNRYFVHNYSDADAVAVYEAAVAPANPQSPSALLGVYGRRDVVVESVNTRLSADPNIPSTATVQFSTTLSGVGDSTKTRWTATIGYYYSDASINEVPDPETGQTKAELVEPTFQVVNYAVAQSR